MFKSDLGIASVTFCGLMLILGGISVPSLAADSTIPELTTDPFFHSLTKTSTLLSNGYFRCGGGVGVKKIWFTRRWWDWATSFGSDSYKVHLIQDCGSFFSEFLQLSRQRGDNTDNWQVVTAALGYVTSIPDQNSGFEQLLFAAFENGKQDIAKKIQELGLKSGPPATPTKLLNFVRRDEFPQAEFVLRNFDRTAPIDPKNISYFQILSPDEYMAYSNKKRADDILARLQFMKNNGFSLTQKNTDGETVFTGFFRLHIYESAFDMTIWDYLLKEGADPLATNSYGRNALDVLLASLLKLKMDIRNSARASDKRSFDATVGKVSYMIKTLIQAGKLRDTWQPYSPLFSEFFNGTKQRLSPYAQAIRIGDVNLAQILENSGVVDTSLGQTGEFSVLMAAAESDSEEIKKHVLSRLHALPQAEQDALIRQTTSTQETAFTIGLKYLAWSRHHKTDLDYIFSVARPISQVVYLSSGKPIELIPYVASKEEPLRFDLFQRLQKAGFDLSKDGSVLNIAVRSCDRNYFNLAMQIGSDINQPTDDALPIESAAVKGCFELVNQLLALGAKPGTAWNTLVTPELINKFLSPSQFLQIATAFRKTGINLQTASATEGNVLKQFPSLKAEWKILTSSATWAEVEKQLARQKKRTVRYGRVIEPVDYFGVHFEIDETNISPELMSLVDKMVDGIPMSQLNEELDNLFIAKHVKSGPNGKITAEDVSSQLLNQARSIQTSTDVKAVLDTVLTQSIAPEPVKYNRAAVSIVDVLTRGRIQCFSGTVTSLLLWRKAEALKGHAEVRPVAVFRSGHVLFGEMKKTLDHWELSGYETTVAGKGVVDLKNPNEWPADITVVRAGDFLLTEVLKEIIANPTQVRDQYLALASKHYGFTQRQVALPHLYQLTKAALNEGLFGFGYDSTPDGDFERLPQDKVDPVSGSDKMLNIPPPPPGAVLNFSASANPRAIDQMAHAFRNLYNVEVSENLFYAAKDHASGLFQHPQFQDVQNFAPLPEGTLRLYNASPNSPDLRSRGRIENRVIETRIRGFRDSYFVSGIPLKERVLVGEEIVITRADEDWIDSQNLGMAACWVPNDSANTQTIFRPETRGADTPLSRLSIAAPYTENPLYSLIVFLDPKSPHPDSQDPTCRQSGDCTVGFCIVPNRVLEIWKQLPLPKPEKKDSYEAEPA